MTEKTMPITGGCLCGAVRYEAIEPPTEVGICHCRMCQRVSGNAHTVTAVIPAKAFKFTRGAPKFYKSSAWAERGFCAECGSPIIFRDRTETHGILVGTFDHPEEWPPTLHVGIEGQISWDIIHDELPRLRSEEHPELIAAKEAAERDEE
jgi:hypothetical protein